MILSGVLFSFDKLNNVISTKGKVPLIADIMASRWAYEAMAVYQFTSNAYEAPFYEYEKQAAIADFKSANLMVDLKARNKFIIDNLGSKDKQAIEESIKNIDILKNNLQSEKFKNGIEKIDLSKLATNNFTKEVGEQLDNYFEEYKKHYQKIYLQNESKIDKKMAKLEKKGQPVNEQKNAYFNESLADLVRNINVKERLLEYNGELIQQINPVFQNPKPSTIFDYRTQFFAPIKNLLGMRISTFWFNNLVIWIMTGLFYGFLYFELLKKGIDSFGKISLPKKK
jgi:hypothetical protein